MAALTKLFEIEKMAARIRSKIEGGKMHIPVIEPKPDGSLALLRPRVESSKDREEAGRSYLL